uniref:Ac81-like protein n=1 Tax=Faxonius propinquus nudivirus TaxID=3139431 RepID=A0AAU8GBR3_9VIRU
MSYKIEVYIKHTKNTLGVLSHYFFTIPKLKLEIHPGVFYNGTHHDLGRYHKRTHKIKTFEICQNCLDFLLENAIDLKSVWYYPIINCETLTRGLIDSFPLSYQTVLLTICFTSFILAIHYKLMFIICFFSIFLLIILNSFYITKTIKKCIHTKNNNLV